MKKRFLSIALTLAMVSSMAIGCGSSKSDSADSKKEEGAKTEASADTESNQILFNGSSTLCIQSCNIYKIEMRKLPQLLSKFGDNSIFNFFLHFTKLLELFN